MPRLAPPREAVEALVDGAVALLPTEDGWVLACRGDAPEALALLRQAAERAADEPLAVAFASWNEARLFIEPNAAAEAVAERLLPGPLTLVLQHDGAWFGDATPGRETLAVRVPTHPTFQGILTEAGPLAVVRVGADGAAAARRTEAFETPTLEVLVVAGEVDSRTATVVAATGKTPRLLREGVIAMKEVEAAWTSA